MTTRQSATGAGTAKPKFLVTCGCGTTADGQVIYCLDEHVEPGKVAAKCNECDDPAAVSLEATGGTGFLCESCAYPCWKCHGVGCRHCGDSGSEAKRRILQNCAELPAFTGEEPTQDIPVETMREAVSR